MEKTASVTDFEKYLLHEWNQFKGNSARTRATLQAVNGLDVRRVLDIGCGAGQEMLPLIEGGAFGVGIDHNAEAGTVGKRYFASTKAAFARCSGEDLPFRSESFDVLICRLALPYMDNAKAFAEMCRVLRPKGRLLLKIHAAPYYMVKCWTGIRRADPLFVIHALRVLTAGTIYHLTGRQAAAGLWTKEVFQSERLLRRELAKVNMAIMNKLPDTNLQTPSFVIVKH